VGQEDLLSDQNCWW